MSATEENKKDCRREKDDDKEGQIQSFYKIVNFNDVFILSYGPSIFCLFIIFMKFNLKKRVILF